MPKWRNEQQVCGTYTREAHTVGVRMGEKGTHMRRARQRGARMRGAHGKGGGCACRARTAMGAQMATRSAYSHRGTLDSGGRECLWGRAWQQKPRTAKGHIGTRP
jgi:hypothetical protein